MISFPLILKLSVFLLDVLKKKKKVLVPTHHC